MTISEAGKYMQCFKLPSTFEYWKRMPDNIIDVFYYRLGMVKSLEIQYDPYLGIVKKREKRYYNKINKDNWDWHDLTGAYDTDGMNMVDLFTYDCSLMACIYCVVKVFDFKRCNMESANDEKIMEILDFALTISFCIEDDEDFMYADLIHETKEFIRLGALYLFYKIENIVPDGEEYQRVLDCRYAEYGTVTVMDYVDEFLNDIMNDLELSEEEFKICSRAILSLYFSFDYAEDETTGRLYIYSSKQIKNYITNKNNCRNKELIQMMDTLVDQMESPFLFRNEEYYYTVGGEAKNSCIYAYYMIANSDNVITNPLFLLAVNLFIALYEEFEREIMYAEIDS